MNRKLLFRAIIISLLFGVNGCAPIISDTLQAKVPEDLTYQSVKENPDIYIGETVIWGGVIIKTTNVKEGTRIEVLQKPLDFKLRPKSGDVTYGRFLALYDGYLDSAIYANGRKITVGGEILGQQTGSLDEIQYTYPLISVTEHHLWSEKDITDYHYDYPYHFYRHWWHYPYWVY